MAQRMLQFVQVSAEQAVVKRGVRELLVSGADAVPLVASVVEELARGADPDDVLLRSPDGTRAAVEQLLAALRARGFLREPQPPGQEDLLPAQRVFFDSLDSPAESRAALRTATVLVLGSTMITRSLLAGLDGLPLAAVRVADTEPDLPLEQADLVVATSDTGDLDALLAVNRRAIAAGRPFLPVWVEPTAGWVGPLVVPGQAACLRCHGHTRTSVDRGGAPDGGLRSLAGICGRIAATEVLRQLTGFAPPAAVARVLRVDATSLQASPQRVFKNPRCSHCSEIARHRVPVVLTGPQIPHG